MNKKNIKKLIEKIKTVRYTSNAEGAKSGFNMEAYRHDCGTPSCMAGWASFISDPVAYKTTPRINEWDENMDIKRAVDWLDMPENELDILFHPNIPEDMDWNLIKPKHAIAALEIVLKEKKVSKDIWARVFA